MTNEKLRRSGIGMTSQRTRNRLISRLSSLGIQDKRVLSAIEETPRHLFIDEALASRAYEDTALPIGCGQTISQPYVVALMTEAILRNGVPDKVLEIGTGCGYQAAILARIVPEVFTMERIDELHRQARRRFRELRLHNIRTKHADGFEGWPERGPYGGIVVTAAPEEVPQALVEQLATGGTLVIPVGPPGHQQLVALTRTESGELERRRLGAVTFVPLLENLD